MEFCCYFCKKYFEKRRYPKDPIKVFCSRECCHKNLRRDGIKIFVCRLKQIYENSVELDESSYINNIKKCRFIDKDYGEWWDFPQTVLKGRGHPEKDLANKIKYMKNKRAEFVGKQFGKLTVINFNEQKSAEINRDYYDCKCNCDFGKIVMVRIDVLENGGVTSCGCSRIKDLTGKIFGTLTVLSRTKRNSKTKQAYWKCLCECKKIITIRGSHLISGNVQSCGKCAKIEDLSGNIYGKLIAVDIDYGYKARVRWFCKCECGNIISVQANNLSNGHIKSCGCVSREYNKQTCLDKYGADHPSKVPEIATKMARNQTQSTMLYHWRTGEEIICQASYEVAVVNAYNEHKIDYQWKPKIFTMPNGHTYLPDMYIPSIDLWIEIKGYFRKDAKEKWEWFHKEYSNSALWDREKLKDLGIL